MLLAVLLRVIKNDNKSGCCYRGNANNDRSIFSCRPQNIVMVGRIYRLIGFSVFIWAAVVVKGKCQGLMFSDFVSQTPFRQLRRLVPRLR